MPSRTHRLSEEEMAVVVPEKQVDEKLELAALAYLSAKRCGKPEADDWALKCIDRLSYYALQILIRGGANKWLKEEGRDLKDLAYDMAVDFVFKILENKYDPEIGPVRNLARRVFKKLAARERNRCLFVNDDKSRRRKRELRENWSSIQVHLPEPDEIVKKPEDKVAFRPNPPNIRSLPPERVRATIAQLFSGGRSVLTPRQAAVLCLYYGTSENFTDTAAARVLKVSLTTVQQLLKKIEDHLISQGLKVEDSEAVKQYCLKLLDDQANQCLVGDVRMLSLLYLRYFHCPLPEASVGRILGISQQAVSKNLAVAMAKINNEANRLCRQHNRKLLRRLVRCGMVQHLLDQEEKTIIELYYFNDRKDKDIAKTLGITQQALNKKRRRVENKIVSAIGTTTIRLTSTTEK